MDRLRRRLAALAGVLICAAVCFASPAFADDDMQTMVKDLVAKELGSKGGLQARWSSGLRFQSADGKFKIKVGGLIQLDHWWIDDENPTALGQNVNYEDGVEARRIRLYNAGLIYGNVEYKLSMDFRDPEDPQFSDLYVGLVNLDECWGCLMPNIRIGLMKAPLGLEALTSSKYLTFMERSAVTQAFTGGYGFEDDDDSFGRRYGLMFHDCLMGGQMSWALGWFAREAQDGDENFLEDGDLDFDDGYSFVGRVTYTPWNDCDCACRLLHLGIGFEYCDLGTAAGQVDGRAIRFRARPFHDSGLWWADTGLFLAQDYFMLDFELALVYGPWSLQAEYFLCDVSSTTANDPSFSGWYVQGSYWLTGECRNYNCGVFNRVKPCCNFLERECCCWGAFELAVRYDSVDLEDQNVRGGELNTLTVGINWHLNPNTRVMLNYVYVDGTRVGLHRIDRLVDLDFSGIGIRLQVDW